VVLFHRQLSWIILLMAFLLLVQSLKTVFVLEKTTQ